MPQREQGPRRRRRRSSAEIARLKALRQAHAERLERVRADEQRVEDALEPFAAAAEAIAAAEQRHENGLAKVAAKLERDLADLDRARARVVDAASDERQKLKDALDVETGKLRAVMGESVVAIHEVGTGMPETAELLGITLREARSLAAAANRSAERTRELDTSLEEISDESVHTTPTEGGDVVGVADQWRPEPDPEED